MGASRSSATLPARRPRAHVVPARQHTGPSLTLRHPDDGPSFIRRRASAPSSTDRMLRVGAAWWNCFASLAGGPEVNNTSPAKGERHAPAKAGLGEQSG
jgi:hypothetical protein